MVGVTMSEAEPRGVEPLDPGPEEFLARIDEADRAGLVARGRQRRWPAGATLFLEGDTSSTVVIVMAGRVKVFSITEQGEEIVLAVRGPGALLGELAAIDGGARGASVSALEPVTGIVLAVPVFTEFLAAHGQAATVLLRLITSRLRDADRKRVEFGSFDIAARVAGRLVELADRFGEAVDGGVRISVPLSQDELAGWVGASREAVAKTLRVLRQRGLVTTGRRTMTVLDVEALRERARG
jgi:CRP-like cAMP-binding protein